MHGLQSHHFDFFAAAFLTGQDLVKEEDGLMDWNESPTKPQLKG